jgi:hypothetical protein
MKIGVDLCHVFCEPGAGTVIKVKNKMLYSFIINSFPQSHIHQVKINRTISQITKGKKQVLKKKKM